jgi:hypothetical protein
MEMLPLSVAPSSTISRAAVASPSSVPDPLSDSRCALLTFPVTCPRMSTLRASMLAMTVADDSTITSPEATISPSTSP